MVQSSVYQLLPQLHSLQNVLIVISVIYLRLTGFWFSSSWKLKKVELWIYTLCNLSHISLKYISKISSGVVNVKCRCCVHSTCVITAAEAARTWQTFDKNEIWEDKLAAIHYVASVVECVYLCLCVSPNIVKNLGQQLQRVHPQYVVNQA